MEFAAQALGARWHSRSQGEKDGEEGMQKESSLEGLLFHFKTVKL